MLQGFSSTLIGSGEEYPTHLKHEAKSENKWFATRMQRWEGREGGLTVARESLDEVPLFRRYN